MSDQKRLLFAAALMAAVLFISWQFMSKSGDGSPQENRIPEETEEQVGNGQSDVYQQQIDDVQQSEIPSDPVTEPDSSEVDTSEQTTGTEERIIVVVVKDGNDEIVRARISTICATITSWELPQYQDMPGSGNGVPMNFDGDQWWINSDYFHTDSPDTVVVDNGPVSITFTSLDNTKTIKYTFSPGSYGFGLETEGLGQRISLNSGILPVSEMNVNPAKYFKAQWNADDMDDIDSDDIDGNVQTGNVEWLAARSKYFGIVILPQSFQRAYGFVYESLPDESPSIGVEDSRVYIYAGPLDYSRLRELGRDTHLMVDFGWPIIRDIGRLLFWISNSVLAFVGNWGLKIILLSIILKVVLMPLTTKSFKSMAKLKQVQPKMKALQDKYKNDPKALQSAMQKLYREEGVNPLGGCLPLIMQMPVFFALYRVLANSVQLRGAPFILWIKDLSNPEILIPFSSPILGLHGIGLLALLMGLAMFMQQKMTMTEQSQKGMMYIMPIFFTFLFMRFPAGLTLYWFMNNLLTIGQQKIIKKQLEAEGS
ncbi:MAG: membrane protein insertase YidC [Candidatus Aegiribacteria sp.]|nr:membrane protein insertase YidC [Candidatus Aegiribacteria sp.]MBD3295649.1 membrane protein insertase YidC [Candidatus Fermentibacteria bacterium]